MNQLIPPSIDPYELEVELVSWAKVHFPMAADAIDRSEDRQWRLRCLASIARKRAGEDQNWLVRAIRMRPSQVLSLAPWLGKLCGFPPDGMTWQQWIDELSNLGLDVT